MNELLKEKDNFYPTPALLADKLCDMVISDTDFTFLEPSGGKGDLVDAILRKMEGRYYGSHWHDGERPMSIDVIEIDQELRGILKSKYSEAERDATNNAIHELEDKERAWNSETREYENLLTDVEKEALSLLTIHRKQLAYTDVRVVFDDFLNYQAKKHYDCIIMNPPFDEGDLHLLKALEFAKDGCKIACILNAETIRNPYSKTRKLLVSKLNSLDAEIEFLPMEFAGADSERKTEVTIALIKVVVPEGQYDYKSEILEGMKKAKEEKEEAFEATAVTSKTNWIDSLIEEYQFEAECGMRLYREYQAIKPYMCVDYEKKSYSSDIITLKCGNRDFSPNAFLKAVRCKYWNKFFTNPQFSEALTSNLQQCFRDIVDDAANYEFDRFNIEEILKKMELLMMQAREDTIIALFDKLSEEHSWYPECKDNIHYFNGWKTNTAHMINTKKVIIPIYGAFADASWKQELLNTYTVYNVLADIEKVLNYLSVGSNDDIPKVSLSHMLDFASRNMVSKNINLTYFTITLYKKGTCHITFHPETKELIERLNIYASRKKGWLPPYYGKKKYDDMDPEEKEVIDSFQGKEAYEKVCSNAAFYLEDFSADMSSMFMLPAC